MLRDALHQWISASRPLHRAMLFCYAWLMLFGSGQAFTAPLAAPRGLMQTKRGRVSYTRPPAASIPAAVPQPLEVKDHLAVGESSWAILRFQDASEVKVRELTELQIVEPAVARGLSFHLLKGEAYFSGLQQSHDAVVQTPHAGIVPGGTEFLIRVTDHETEVIMFDGHADMTNSQGGIVVKAGEQGVAEADRAPRLRAAVEARNIVQWWLYYPGVLDPKDLGLSPAAQQTLEPSLSAYRSGDLIAALEKFPGYPSPPTPATDAEKVYLAGLLLALGAVDRAEVQLSMMTSNAPAASALRELISAVTLTNLTSHLPPRSASEWLASSYLQQAKHDLSGALTAARQAVKLSPDFAFAWERVAELEFSFGRIRPARDALERGLRLAPRNAQAHALRGFLLSAENRIDAAQVAFEEAVRVDPGLANGWLGHGLVRIRKGHPEEGLADLQTAAAMEPNRAFLRSYLAKAYHQASRCATRQERQEMLRKAAEELALAKRSDPNDPTAWLYSALLNRDENRFNEAVSDLEESVQLNDNRRVYRSSFLLDQDRAVRSSSLANVYQAAGLRDASLSEAAQAVNADYANASAHMFLSDSYNVLRDPTRFNLRYETPWFAERLLAYLLGPIGSTPLSQNISQQEYSRLFEANRLGLSSFSEYRTDGQYYEQASQFGTIGGTSYALDLDYRHNNGVRPNNDLDRIEWYSALNQQVGPRDSLFIETKYQELRSGDNFQYFDPRQADRDFRFGEFQRPWVVGGFHHEWTPGVHTLLLGGRLVNDQRIRDLNLPRSIITRNSSNEITGFSSSAFDLRYRSEFEAYIGEFNQIFQTERQTLIVGARVQRGTFQTTNYLTATVPKQNLPPTSQRVEDDLDRVSGYGYYTAELVRNLLVTAGLAYDRLIFPKNFRQAPVSDGQDRREYLNPKAAIVWSPLSEIRLRGSYARPLGGVSYDESFRLEPTQLAGFNQSFRTIISESVAGPVTGPLYQTAGAALDLKLKTRTYAGLEFQWLTSDVRRRRGVFEFTPNSPVAVPSSLEQRLDYDERSAAIWLNQLVANDWSFGARYQFTRSELGTRFPEVPVAVFGGADANKRADLHRVTAQGRYQHSSGLFGRAEWDWYHQSNSEQHFVSGSRVRSELPGDSFGQVNAFLGYRFPRQRGELWFGVLNAAGGDYHLDPLNVYSELPRERVWVARLLFNF